MTLVRSSASFIAAQVFLVIVGLVSSIVVARWLGPESRGVVALVSLIVTLVTAFATLGLGTSYAYLGGKQLHDGAELIGSALIMALALGIATIAVLLLASGALLESVLRGMTWFQLAITSASIPFAYVTYFLTNFLIGSGQAARAAWMQLCAGIFLASLVVAAVVVGHQGVTGVVVVTALATVIVAGWSIVIVVGQYGISLAGALKIGATATAFGLRAYLGTISSQFWARADFLILDYYAGPAAVGQYAVATGVAERVWLLDTAVSQVTLHDVIGSPPEDAARLVARTSRNVMLLAGLGSAALAVLSPFLVPLLFSSEFSPAVGPLVLLLPGVLAIGVARPISSYFFGQLGKPQITSAVSIVTAIISIAAYLAFVPRLGATGAAIGSSLSYMVPLLVYIPLFGRMTGTSAREILAVDRSDVDAYARIVRTALGRSA